MTYTDVTASIARVDAHLALAEIAIAKLTPAVPAPEPTPDWALVNAADARANAPAPEPMNPTQVLMERTRVASDALVDYLVSNPVWRGEIAHAIHGMPQGLPGVNPAIVVRDAVQSLGLMGIPPMVTWARVAKRLLSQLAETGDEYRVRCHVVALEEAPAGTYRSQGDHGQAWDGDWVRDEPALPWWWTDGHVKLTSYHVDGDLELAVAVWPGGTKPRAKVVRMDD